MKAWCFYPLAPHPLSSTLQAATAFEEAERKAREAAERAARRRTFALFHIVTEVHQACSPVPQGNERTEWSSGARGSSVDALPLSHAIRCTLRLGDDSAELYSAVQVSSLVEVSSSVCHFVCPPLVSFFAAQSALGIPHGSFLLWAAKRREEESGSALRPAVMWPGCPWLPAVAAESTEDDLTIAQVCDDTRAFF